MRWPVGNISRAAGRRALLCLSLVLLAFTVRLLTAQFIGQHIENPSWFASGIYAIFDNRAQDILEGRAHAFWAEDALSSPRAATAAVYPPGYSLWLAFLYSISGSRSVFVVQFVQMVLDSLFVLLIAGVGTTAYGWHTGLMAGVLASLSPLLAFYGATPLADSPTAWIVVGGAWMLLLAMKRLSWRWALGAGLMIGASCWLRANALLLGLWCALALLLFVQATWPVALRLSGMFALGALLLIAPVIVRNSVAFHAFVPGGMGFGTNLWEGLGETSRAEEFGAVFGDAALIERERLEMGFPPEAELALYWPDGLERDRARMRKAVGVIKSHPFWYAGVMARRMTGMLKYAGEPVPYFGTAGINVTSKKCLPPAWQGGALALTVNVLGMLQSVLRYLLLPLMLFGVFLALRRERRQTALLLSVILYYLAVGSIMHTELRYGLPMQALLFLFAGLTIETVRSLKVRSPESKERPAFDQLTPDSKTPDSGLSS
ncbi:MAG TPA: glycosyltransferase family 39 protein [Pyrinomonadaceae bacterium]|nr:glycosyltransferase family 39 protein [Pyrinomonadaceae bacterium]